MSVKNKKRKQLIGQIISNLMDKTVIVKVESRFSHPTYNKYVKKTKKYYAHDPLNKCNDGDEVIIEESKPISRLKRWKVLKINKKSVKI